MASSIKPVIPGVAPYASDVDQFRQIFSGVADVGLLPLAPRQAAPSAPTLSLVASGPLNGVYKYKTVAVTGWKENSGAIWVSGFAPSAEASITAANQSVSVTLPTLVTPVVAYLVYRTAAGGNSYSLKFVGAISSGVTSWTDTVADGSIGTGMPTWNGSAIPSSLPTSNSTGTVIDPSELSSFASIPDSNGIYTVVSYARPDGSTFMKSTLSGGTSPNYTSVVWTYYAANGTTIIGTKKWQITYDANGKILTKVVLA